MTDYTTSDSVSQAPKGFFSAPTDRPLSISIVGWWLLGNGVLSPLSLLGLINQEAQAIWSEMGLTPSLMITHALVSGLFQAGFGYGILKGRPWGRLGYIGYGAVSLLVSFILLPGIMAGLLFGIVVYGGFCFLLSTPAARAFFEGSFSIGTRQQERKDILAQVRRAQKGGNDVRQIVGAGLVVCAGLLLYIAVYFTGTESVKDSVGGLFTMGAPALALLGIGAFLWGLKRWRGPVGWCLAAVGCIHVLSGISVIAMQRSPMWETMSAQMENAAAMNPTFFLLTGLTGLVLAVLGGGLLITQYRMDGDIAERVLAKREAAQPHDGRGDRSL